MSEELQLHGTLSVAANGVMNTTISLIYFTNGCLNVCALAHVAIPTKTYSKSGVPTSGIFVRLDTKMSKHFYLVAISLGSFLFFFFFLFFHRGTCGQFLEKC